MRYHTFINLLTAVVALATIALGYFFFEPIIGPALQLFTSAG